MPPLKTIAIPTSAGAKRGKRAAVALSAATDPAPHDDLPSGSLLRRPARPVQVQPTHRYRVGEKLRMANGGYTLARAGASCKVVSALPYEGRGPLLYRVRSDTEAFERVVSEADLTRGAE